MKYVQSRNRRSAEATATPQVNFDPDSVGQSGEVANLSSIAEADSENVKELAEEEQAFEAAAVSGVKDAPGPEVAEVIRKSQRTTFRKNACKTTKVESFKASLRPNLTLLCTGYLVGRKRKEPYASLYPS